MLTRTVADPIWLGAFKIRPELVCEACTRLATRRCAWIWRGQVAMLLLCEACSEAAAVARSGDGRRFTGSGTRVNEDTPVRAEVPASALAIAVR